MTTDEISGKPRVPVEELKALVDEIEDERYTNDDTERYPYRTGVGRGMNRANSRLKALIERYDYE